MKKMSQSFPTPVGSLLFGLVALLASACDRTPSPASTREERPPATDVEATSDTNSPEGDQAAAASSAPAESDASPLNVRLKQACLDAQDENRPLLIEFSADWCGDCRRLQEMKQEEPLAEAWQDAPHFEVDVGHFDENDELREAFGVKAIAAWHLVDTSSCERPATAWPRLAARTLEPRSGEPVTPTELAEWLQEER